MWRPFLPVPPEEPFPWKRYKTTKFVENIIGEEQGQIGCHIISGTLKMPKLNRTRTHYIFSLTCVNNFPHFLHENVKKKEK